MLFEKVKHLYNESNCTYMYAIHLHQWKKLKRPTGVNIFDTFFSFNFIAIANVFWIVAGLKAEPIVYISVKVMSVIACFTPLLLFVSIFTLTKEQIIVFEYC